MNTRDRTAIDDAIDAGLEYVLSLQALDGSWTEWKLPPGESSLWTTAFVGYKLRRLTSALAKKAPGARQRAAEWLIRAELDGGGWGYNDAVGADADSTAYGILFLSSLGRGVREVTYRRLCEFRQADGGFSTYVGQHDGDSWGGSHPDVTPIAVLALMTKHPPTSNLVEGGIGYVLRQQTSAGLWNSFWWESPLYATEASLELLDSAEVPVDTSKTSEALLSLEPHNAFEAALLLSSLLHVGSGLLSAANRALIDGLIEGQQSDGSWKSEPILRVTRRDCVEPWNHHDAGARFADPARLFASSVVLDALAKTSELLSGVRGQGVILDTQENNC
jgi:hypothetical protein